MACDGLVVSYGAIIGVGVDVDVDVGVGVGVDVEVDSAVVVLFFLPSSSLIVYPIINFTAIFIWDYRLVTAAVSSSSSVDASLSKFVNLAILVWPMLPVD